MKKIYSLLLVICIFLGFGDVRAFATQEPRDEAVMNGTHSLDATDSVLGRTKLIENAESVLFYERNSETMMYAWNADERQSPASLVKIMTALITLENVSLDDLVKINQESLDTLPWDARVSGLKAGESFSVEQMLYFLMVDSGNDAAVALAEHVAGDQEGFIDLMNQRAQELGCTNTNFENVHGLHHDNQYMSARDTARILTEALKIDQFKTVFSTVECSVPATALSPKRELYTDNLLLSRKIMMAYYDERVSGSRAGTNQSGKRSVASVAGSGGMDFIVVVMGCSNVYDETGVNTRQYGGYHETNQLLEMGFSKYKTVQVLYDGQVIRQAQVHDGDSLVSLGCRDAVTVVLPYGTDFEDLSLEYEDLPGMLTAPVEKGRKVSVLRVRYNGTYIAQTDLYALNSVSSASDPDLIIRKAESSGASFWSILLWIAVIAIILAIAVYALRMARRKGYFKVKNGRNHPARRRR